MVGRQRTLGRRARGAAVAVLLGVAVACAANPPPAPVPNPPVATGSAEAPYVARAGEALTPVKASTCTVSGGFLHMYMAVDANIFPRYGLQVEHVLIVGSTLSLAAMGVNELQFLYCAADATIPGLVSNPESKIVAAPLLGVPYVLVARPEVRSVADLRGKSISVGRAGQLPDKLSRLMLQKHGLRPNEDTMIRPIAGTQVDNYRAVAGGVVDAAAVTPPLNAQARQDGLNVIYDLADLGIPFVYSAVHANNATLQQQPQTVQRFVAAMAEAVYFTEKNPDVARQVLGKVLDLQDSEALDAAYQAYAIKHVNRRMTIPLDAIAATIDEVRQAGTNVTVGGAEDIAITTFVDDLERSGFLARLWGGEPP